MTSNVENTLATFVHDAIRERGPMTFRWFMEQALYHPEHGFYSSGRCVIGRDGDYFTNISVGPLFGRLMSRQFAEMWELLGQPNEFTIVEQGANNGDFARDVFEATRADRPEFFDALRYRIIEPFPTLQLRQEAKLEEFRTRIEWQKSLEQLEPFTGVHFSNEVIDSMPVHLVSASNGDWQEKYVASVSENFGFVNGPLSNGELRKRLEKFPRPDSNYETEINLAASDWIEMLSTKLQRGFVLAVDYGYSREEYFAAERTEGTLRSFANHRNVSSPLQNVGQTDITAHVDWTSVAERAEEYGLDVAGFADQHHFITALAATLSPDALSPRALRALQTLLHPELLGRTFQFLALSKNLSNASRLTGFRFARDPRVMLGLKPH